jgi:site-specific DNA-methyltransferase (adenine-specific)
MYRNTNLFEIDNGSAFVMQANHETMKNMEAKKLNKTNNKQGACQYETLVIPPSNEVFLMDCMEGMKQYPDNYFDLAIVDPPYGIGESSKNFASRSKLASADKYVQKDWDNEKPTDEYFLELFRVSKNQIIWGGNYLVGKTTPCMIVWDKDNTGDFADCEIAWTSFKTAVRKFKFRWNGMLQENMKNKENRIHPTQKPVKLYEWLLTNYANKGDKIIDTHVGSGSSRIACHKMGFDFTGYEIDEDYWNAQEQRFKQFKKQLTLF